MDSSRASGRGRGSVICSSEGLCVAGWEIGFWFGVTDNTRTGVGMAIAVGRDSCSGKSACTKGGAGGEGLVVAAGIGIALLRALSLA